MHLMHDIAPPLRGNGFTAPLLAINTPKKLAKFIRGIGEGISMVGASGEEAEGFQLSDANGGRSMLEGGS